MTSDSGSQNGVRFTGDTRFREPIVEAIKTVYDPEIPIDIYELGLIYEVEVDDAAKADVKMTLTSPACPSAEAIPVEVREKIAAIQGLSDVNVEVVWDPPWTQDFMSDAAKVALGMF